MATGVAPGPETAAADVLESVCAAEAAIWRFEPDHDRLHLSGALPASLAALAPHCPTAAFLAMIAPQDRRAAEALFSPRAGGAVIEVVLRPADAPAASYRWRGAWLERGAATGMASAEPKAARTDPLTSLLHRDAFLEALAERLHRKGPVRVVVADLARLRQLNEALGPGGADIVLRTLASRLLAAFSPSATAARIGEDEFGLLIEDADTVGGDPADRLREALERPMRVQGFDIHPSLWIGAARADGGRDAPAAGELLRRAALDLEAAKAAAKSATATAAPPSSVSGLTRLALEADLHGALGRGEIVPFYQPIAHLESGRLAGFEALARWNHPVRGLVLPDEFLPLMSDAGLMGALGQHMLRTAAAQVAAWRRAHPDAGDLFVAVNLSTGELDDERLVDFVGGVIRDNGLPPRALKVEVTESDMMRDPERAGVVLKALRDAGAGVSLDDFGTGFSSLAYLTRLPFETLKIDRYFVRTMAENEGSAKIVRSVATLGRDLGLEVVAEGVETVAVARQLQALGCQYGQGYGYAPALEAQEAEVYLNESYLDGAPLRVTA